MYRKCAKNLILTTLVPVTVNMASEAIFNELSSGHKIVLLTLTQLIAVVKERTLLFIDEPELHLHPPLVASYIQSISYLLKKKNGVAIVATHSPVVLQEIPAKCVWHINRSGSFLTARHPRIQTYGENLGVITKEIFRHELEDTGHRRVLSRLSDEGLSFEEIMDRLENQLGIEGQMMLSMILGYRDEKYKET